MPALVEISDSFPIPWFGNTTPSPSLIQLLVVLQVVEKQD